MAGRGRFSLGLKLQIDDPMEDTISNMESTYRKEGLSINYNGIRIEGEYVDQIHQDDLLFDNHILGRGACSYVTLAKHRSSNALFAVKVFNVFDSTKRTQLLSEIKTLYNVDCPCLIGFYGSYYNSGNISVILEFMDLGSLEDLIKETRLSSLSPDGRGNNNNNNNNNNNHQPIPEEVLAAISYQIIWGICYLHYENRIHRDIKPCNVLFNSNGEVKLTDFGIARDLNEQSSTETMVGTFRYMSPERLTGDSYGPLSDIWSIGLTILECAKGQYPLKKEAGANPLELYINLQDLDMESVIDTPYIRNYYSEEFCEFISLCLYKETKKRVPAQFLLESPFFEKYAMNNLDFAVETVYQYLEHRNRQNNNSNQHQQQHQQQQYNGK